MPASAKLAQGDRRIGDQDAQHRGQLAVEDLLAVRAQVVEIVEDLLDPGYILGRAVDLDGVGLEIDDDIESILKQVKVFVARSEQGFEIGTKFDVFLHREIRFTSGAACADEHR